MTCSLYTRCYSRPRATEWPTLQTLGLTWLWVSKERQPTLSIYAMGESTVRFKTTPPEEPRSWYWLKNPIDRGDMDSVSNRSKFPVQFRVRFQPGTGTLQWISTENLLFKSQHFLLQLSTEVLIVSQHNLYLKYAVWCPLSSPFLRFAIGQIVVESRWKPGHFDVIFGLISKRLNKYWSDRKSGNGRWNRASICTLHV